MKSIFIVLLSFVWCHLFSQEKEDIAFQKVKAFCESHTIYTCNYNKFNHSLKIQDWIVNILDAKFEYSVGGNTGYEIEITCIRDPNKKPDPSDEMQVEVYNNPPPESSAFCKDCLRDISSQPIGALNLGGFKSEKDCYTLINLIAELRSAIKNY